LDAMERFPFGLAKSEALKNALFFWAYFSPILTALAADVAGKHRFRIAPLVVDDARHAGKPKECCLPLRQEPVRGIGHIVDRHHVAEAIFEGNQGGIECVTLGGAFKALRQATEQ